MIHDSESVSDNQKDLKLPQKIIKHIHLVICLIVLFISQNNLLFASDDTSAKKYMSMLLDRSERGYLPVKDGQLWYWFVKADIPNAPLTIWLNGGPGCSSMFGLFGENGPYLLRDMMTSTESTPYQLKTNPHAWTQVSNMLYLDNPLGTGFSLPLAHDVSPVTIRQDVVLALQQFFKLHTPLKERPLFIFGESYAGQYIPHIAYEIKRTTDFNLQGIGIGNGFIDPESINLAQVAFSEKNRLITHEDAKELLAMVQAKWQHFYEAIDSKQAIHPRFGHHTVYFALHELKKNMKKKYQISKVNTYDIRIIDKPYQCGNLSAFLNDKNYKPKEAQGTWARCGKENYTIKKALLPYITQSSAPIISSLLKDYQLPILLFNGMSDLRIPYLSYWRWLGKEKVVMQAIDNTGLSFAANDYPLKLVFVKDSGHMVPIDQPKVAFELFKSFIE